MAQTQLQEDFEAPSRGARTLEEAALVDPNAAEYLADMKAQEPARIAAMLQEDADVVNASYATDMLNGIANIQNLREELGLQDIELGAGGTLAQRFEQYVAQHSEDVLAERDGKKIPAVGKNVKFLKPSKEVTARVDAERAEGGIFDPRLS